MKLKEKMIHFYSRLIPNDNATTTLYIESIEINDTEDLTPLLNPKRQEDPAGLGVVEGNMLNHLYNMVVKKHPEYKLEEQPKDYRFGIKAMFESLLRFLEEN